MRNAGYKISKIEYSTSLVNILYGLLKKNKRQGGIQSDSGDVSVNSRKNLLRQVTKIFCEFSDKSITFLFPELFAYQFMIIAKPR